MSDSVSTLVQQAVDRLRSRKFQEAVDLFRQAIVLHPTSSLLHGHLAGALHLWGRTDEAIPSYVKALELDSQNSEVATNLGTALTELVGMPPDFRPAANGALTPEAWFQLGDGLLRLSRPREALVLLRRAAEFAPNSCEISAKVGRALQQLGHTGQAIDIYRKCIATDPERPEPYWLLGTTFASSGQFEEALEPLKKFAELSPNSAEVLTAIGYVYERLGDPAAAKQFHQAASKLKGHSLDHVLAEASLPSIPESREHLVDARRNYHATLLRLMEMPGELAPPGVNGGFNPFNLAYHNEDSRSMKETLCKLLRAKSPSLNFTALDRDRRVATDGKIRIGFISTLLKTHTIGMLYRGIIEHIDRRLFHVTIIRFSSRADELSKEIDGFADRVVVLPGELSSQQQFIAREYLDVLFYPDIGMRLETYRLAFSRLAPVQVVSWGHPETTGVDTIDYFISSENIERMGAEADYSERLIKLSRLPCHYEPRWLPKTPFSRDDLGLPRTGTLYGCPQSLFKIHPDFDGILAEIATGDPEGHIVMIEGPERDMGDALRQRWQRTHPVLLRKTIFLERLPYERFNSLIAQCDLLLDPIYFGSGNTMYEAVAQGTPIVTWPGPFMRGRIVAGSYQQMKVDRPPSCDHLKQYASLALALGKNEKRRKKLRRSIVSRANELLADMRAVRELEHFFSAAVEAASQGTRLPDGWRPPAVVE